MKIFISWSGELGNAFAGVLSLWLRNVLQAAKPFVSTDDIGKGQRWFTEISRELESSHIGVVVVTRHALTSPWVMFEAGALSKNIRKSKIVPILVDIEPADVQAPLALFQTVSVNEADFKRMLRMLNSELQDAALPDHLLEKAFLKWWPDFEQEVAALRARTVKTGTPLRSERELLEEILRLSRSLAQPVAARVSDTAPQATDFSGALTSAAVLNRLEKGGDLVGANLIELDLTNVDLSGANLRGANLVRANLRKANLARANLTGANLERAILDDANLAGATLDMANFWRASMTGVRNLATVASLQDANFYKAKLSDQDQAAIPTRLTINASNYMEFFSHFRSRGMKNREMQETFLWAAHAYPGLPFF